jgi:quercetin dioxygenase-like cupin family protein
MGGVVWIASYPRSGNTWIRVFLHALLNVLDGRDELDLNTLAEFSTWDIASQWYAPLLGKPPDEVTKETVAAARPMAQRRIADSVDNISWFFSRAEPGPAEEREYIVRQNRRRQIRFDAGISDFLLTPSLKSELELLMTTLAPGATSGKQPYSHDGEEAGIVMSGQLEIWIDGKSFLLGQGDSFAFKSTLPHRYQNPGTTEAVVIWAITPPSY